jgi:putative transposase
VRHKTNFGKHFLKQFLSLGSKKQDISVPAFPLKLLKWLCKPEWHIHHTPTYASWLNQVEIWFNLITQQAIRRGTFSSVKELVNKIQQYVEQYNRHPKPFMWTATAESILAKIQRLCQRISGT